MYHHNIWKGKICTRVYTVSILAFWMLPSVLNTFDRHIYNINYNFKFNSIRFYILTAAFQ
jgi:hypothetical protein